MKEKLYFVILNHIKEGDHFPLTDHGKLSMFETETEATVAGEKNWVGKNYGFEVFELGGGL